MSHSSSLLSRFYIYQKERFPFLGHGLLILSFTFSAISYSRLCRGVTDFISLKDYLLGCFVTFSLFLLVRIFDEFKDHEDDLKYRSYLPVPRGLISLKELRNIGIAVALLQVGVILIFQMEMLPLYLIVIAWLLLMRVEFFVPEWLRKQQLLYITSHMIIIPLIDLYASGLDWLKEGQWPHNELIWFFLVSFMNGLVLEFGRKIRAPEKEEEGVVSYTSLYGVKGGVLIWLGSLFCTMALAVVAGISIGYETLSYGLFISYFVLFSIPGWLFLFSTKAKYSKWIEYASAGWTVLMYLSLGGVPMLKSLFE